MQQTRSFVIPLCVVLLALATHAPAENRIVFLAGGNNHGHGEHEFNAGCRLLAKALNEQSGLDVKAEVHIGWPADESMLDGAKAIVIYSDADTIVRHGWEKVEALAKKGVGLMFMHYAVHPSSTDGEKYYRPWIGGAFETGWSVNPHWVADLKALPNHPVSRGVNSLVEAYDEFYYHMRFRPERSQVLDLVTATPTRERIKKYINLWNEHGIEGIGKLQTLMWGVERPDGGRGVGFTGGHYHRNWAVDGFRKLVLNAIVWTAKMEVPVDGVTSNPLTEDELNANLHDKDGNKPRLTIPNQGEFKALPAAEIQADRERGFSKPDAGDSRSSITPDIVVKPIFESPVLTATSKTRGVPLDVSLRGARELYLVVSSEGGVSCDWADWINPQLVFTDGSTKDLTALNWKAARAGHGAVNVGKSCEGGPLLVDGKQYERGFGTHAASVIAFDLPAGVERLRGGVAIDDGGMIRNGNPSDASVRFRIYTQDPGEAIDLITSGPKEVPVDMFAVPEGLEVTLWARTPQLYNPTNIDFDAQGRLWVAEGVNYRSKGGRQKAGDRIVVLEDTTGGGKADKSTVFVQDPALASPLGIAVFGRQVVVSQPPEMLVYTDVNGDGKFDGAVDKREVLLKGFGGRQHDHSLHSVTAGPDGLWYWNQGNAGADFTDNSGKSFHMGSAYMNQQSAGKQSDDGHVWIGGFAARMNPDGSNVTIIGHNFRNSYEQTVTSFGDVFQSDNDDPPACRVSAMIEGGNAGFGSADGQRLWEADRRPGQTTSIAEWRQEDPGTMPAGDIYGGGSPTGVAYYENGGLGEKYRGMLLACEAGKNVVFGYFPKPDGADWKLERFDFLTSNKEKQWSGSDFLDGQANNDLKTKFRPSDICVGPDGALYVADWFDARVGGHATHDEMAAGAIYRIAPKGFRSVVPQVDLNTIDGQIGALKNPSVNVRYSGFVMLKAQGARAVPAVAALLNDPNPYIAARAVWLLAQMGETGVAKVVPLLQSGSDDMMRLVAYRALRRANFNVLALAMKVRFDKSPAVLREVALSLRDVPAAQSAALLVEIGQRFDGKDRAYLEAFGLGCSGKESIVYSALAKSMGGAAESWSDTFAWIAWRLHPVEAVPDLKKRILSKKLSPEQRKLALTTLGFVPAQSAADAMMEIASARDSGSNALAVWWLLNRKGNLWSQFGLETALERRGLYDPANVQLLASAMPEVPANEPDLPEPPEIAKLRGDVSRGRAAIATCYTCHRIGSSGVEYGPDLTTFGQQQTTEVIIRAITKPSAEISHGYEGSEITTTDGLTITGIVLSNADPVIIKCVGGFVQVVPKSRIKTLQPLGRSLMFDPRGLGMSPQSIADIVAYLKSL